MKNKQQMAAMESVEREGNKEERDFEREEKENRLVSDLSLSDSEDEIEEKCIEEDEKTDGNTEKDVTISFQYSIRHFFAGRDKDGNISFSVN